MIGRIVRAAFKMRNFALLAGVVVISLITQYLPFTLIGLAAYVYFVLQTMQSPEFQRESAEIEKLDSIHRLSWECSSLFRELSRKLDKNSRNRILSVLREKDELVAFLEKNSEDPLKQRIVEQTVNLSTAFIKLIYNYNVRARELSAINLLKIQERIRSNNRKLGNLRNYDAVLELTKTIEMDERLATRISEERNELEKISVKLDYIESTISAFKHQIISSDSSDPEVGDIEQVINEATALDTVLTENRRERMRM